MKAGICLLLVLEACTLVHAQTGNTGEQVTWGMDRDSVLKVYPAAQPIKETLQVGGVEIDGIPFAVSLEFKGATGGLSEIRWDCVEGEITDPQANTIMQYFRKTYGPPTKENNDAFMQLLWEGKQSMKLIWSPESYYSPAVLRIVFRDPMLEVPGKKD